jgi:two-component system, sensor histidine kinase
MTADSVASDEKLRILIIDDRRDTRRTCEILLTKLGYAVRSAESATEGLELCNEFQPQAVICDIGLPGMSGYDFARAARSQPMTSSTFLIAQTGLSEPEDVKKSLEAGFNLHLTKPVSVTVLTKVFCELRAGGRPTQS